MWDMSAIVELDEKGLVLIPAEIRKKIHSRRFKVSTRGKVVELEPLASLEELEGKYRHRIKSDWEVLEEKSEELVWKR
jgi:bifunctional DNA-binding transcriptional regulator/antitoxin component of YhaV-PrlF toxin-antitoxin module